MSEYILKTSIGTLKGTETENALIFKGIPYAKAERFQKPEMINRLSEEIYDAAKQENDCYQYMSFLDVSEDFYTKEFSSDRQYVFSEDCQQLSITAPKEGNKHPVVIFIHGGGWETGCISDLPYETEEYAKRGIVLVSVGYRLNVFSFYECGNYGLLDQRCAIKWVYDHIEEFGGDRNRIILMGQSSGAMSVMDQILSDDLKEIVKGIICMSGGGILPKIGGKPLRKAEASSFWEKVRNSAGVDKDGVRNADPEVLWKAWHREIQKISNSRYSIPAIDGEIICDIPQNILKEKKDLDVPAIFGVTSSDLLGPVLFLMALRYGNRNARLNRSKVYCYFFDRKLPGYPYRAFHASDLWYMFGNLERSQRAFEDKDYQLHQLMMDYIESFVYTLDPNREYLPEWQPICEHNRSFRWLDGKHDGHISAYRALLKEIYYFVKDKGQV